MDLVPRVRGVALQQGTAALMGEEGMRVCFYVLRYDQRRWYWLVDEEFKGIARIWIQWQDDSPLGTLRWINSVLIGKTKQ